MGDVANQVSGDRRQIVRLDLLKPIRPVARPLLYFAAGALVMWLAGCGSVSMSAEDAAGDVLEAAAAAPDAGAELFPETAPEAPAAAPDAAGEQLEAGAAFPKCSGAQTLQLDGDQGAGANRYCVRYPSGLRCVTHCRDEAGLEHPSLVERMESSSCSAPGLPVFNGPLICAVSCADCPAAAPF